jgi:hypothetical protein
MYPSGGVTYSVMAGFLPAIHAFGARSKENVDGRVEPGHDGMSRDHRDLIIRTGAEYVDCHAV